MAQSTPSDDRDVRADSDFGSRSDSVSLYPDSDPTNSFARPSFLAELASTIESVVIPRLQLKIENGHDSMPIDQAMVRTFVDKLMRGESRDAMRHVEALLERGISMDHLLVDLLGPSARIMGDMWVEDSCNFVDAQSETSTHLSWPHLVWLLWHSKKFDLCLYRKSTRKKNRCANRGWS